MQTIPFSGKILVLGCGGVSRCFIPLLMKHVEIDPSNITIIDMVDNSKRIPDAIQAGVNYVIRKITHQNYKKIFAQYAKAGDVVVDLSYNLGCTDVLDYCHNHDIRYVNTSVELWDPYSNADTQLTVDRTLYVRQVAIRRLVAGWKTKNGPTAILDHGANPGLVSHFTKMGLIQIAEKIIREKPTDARIPQLKIALESRRFSHLAWLTGVKVIHIS
ncbi:MAG: saccharopine dehydrogenase NADP-binding domain-containing protein, partial [Planctomycetaceae bacterium]|nr:saccharopine dehydrogenase NADP-binding domain-containing protein [Planctomycetaceae bacterium]